MLEETDDEILERIQSIEAISVRLSQTLAVASVALRDEDDAEYLFKRIRDFVTTQDDTQNYSVDEYLARLVEMEGLSNMIKELPGLKEVYEHIVDTKEVFLYNRETLYKVLMDMRKRRTLDAVRDNYWMN